MPAKVSIRKSFEPASIVEMADYFDTTATDVMERSVWPDFYCIRHAKEVQIRNNSWSKACETALAHDGQGCRAEMVGLSKHGPSGTSVDGY
jgi:hypothetical protein